MAWLVSRALVSLYTSAHSSPVPAVESSEPGFSGSKPSVRWKSSPIPQAYCAPDKMTEYSRLSRFGMTYGVLEGTTLSAQRLLECFARSVMILSSAVGSPVRTLAPQGEGRGLRAQEADFGLRWHGLLVKYVRHGSESRIALCSEAEDSTEFCKALPKWGMMLSGVLWEQMTLERLINVSGAGYSGGGAATQLARPQQEQWPTPSARDWKDTPGMARMATNPDGSERRREDQLARAVYARIWPTPRSSDGTHGGRVTSRKARNGGNLIEAVSKEIFPTPTANRRDGLQSHGVNVVAGQLNPVFVEWLMGFPLGFTGLKPVGMHKYRRWLSLHGKYCGKEWRKYGEY